MSSKNHNANGYEHALDVLIIAHCTKYFIKKLLACRYMSNFVSIIGMDFIQITIIHDWLSYLECVVLIPKTRTILPNLKIRENI